jgi:hypothetical protein
MFDLEKRSKKVLLSFGAFNKFLRNNVDRKQEQVPPQDFGKSIIIKIKYKLDSQS